MESLEQELRKLQKTTVSKKVGQRLREFKSFGKKDPKEWFSELCFCLLTANSKAQSALQIQEKLGSEGFCNARSEDVKKCIIWAKHRFHNNKTNFIVQAREHLDIKEKIEFIVAQSGEEQAREWLVHNIKGLGYKEASHFLRNVGYFNLAILDRHILNLMAENKIISEKPKSLTKKNYLEIEKKFQALALKLGLIVAELDLYMWYMKTGEVLK
ncbi:MAG: N-glycosylase [Candidatus Diapherotrites archaeon]|uniref:8-oxoguanine DNA glycosylase/AP lyase n=1 Tax=Candidatus Iainarchaeum sp. TaxID=3101447 RepID=A0A2D6M1T7_9ARCH|nr:N-glycosylase [Candidatus Diapherotrites archaeon]